MLGYDVCDDIFGIEWLNDVSIFRVNDETDHSSNGVVVENV